MEEVAAVALKMALVALKPLLTDALSSSHGRTCVTLANFPPLESLPSRTRRGDNTMVKGAN